MAEGFFRAGLAHAGVLLVVTLVYLLYLPRAGFSDRFEWIAGGVLIVGVLAQSGRFFLHMGVGQPGTTSGGTKLTRTGAILIGARARDTGRGVDPDGIGGGIRG